MPNEAPVSINATQGRLFLQRNPGIEALYKQGLDIGEKWYAEENVYKMTIQRFAALSLLVLAYETVQEVYLLAASGFGRGAQARLRSAFEFTVVAAFLATKSEEHAQKFISFQHSEYAKELKHAINIFNRRKGKKRFVAQLQKKLANVSQKLTASKKQFPNLGHSWHEGIWKMADEVGWDMHFFYNYLIPNRYIHASPMMIERKTVEKTEGGLLNDGSPDYDAADEAMRSAFTVLGLSYAVAVDIGIPVPMKDLRKFTKECVTMYHDRPNKTRL